MPERGADAARALPGPPAWPTRIAWIALAGLCAIMGYNSVTRVRHFTPDSMLYVDAARHVVRGQGLASDILGPNTRELPVAQSLPAPFTSYAPLYPLTIAAVARLGPAPSEAALAVAAACWLLVLLLAFALARRAWGEEAALLALAALLVYAPLREAANSAWSEPLGVALLCATLLALPPLRSPRTHAWRAALAGVLAGLTFATRYALSPILALGFLALLDRRPWRRAAREAAAFLVGALGPAALVLARNHLLATSTLPGARESSVALRENVAAALRTLFGEVLARFAWPVEAAAVVAVLALAFALAWRRERTPLPTLRTVATGNAGVLLGWTVLYLLFLVAVGSRRQFDPIDARLVLPAGVTAVLVGCGLIAHGLRVRRSVALAALALAILFVGVREARLAQKKPPRSTAQEIAASERLTWLAHHTGPRDLVIGDDLFDVPFYVQRRALSFSHQPGAERPSPERVRAYALAHRAEYDRFWLVLDDRCASVAEWERMFGPYFARLASGQDTTDDGLAPPVRLRDAIVYRYDPETASTP